MRTPLLVINFKNYQEISGKNSIRLAEYAERVARREDVEIVVCPPLPFLAEVARIVSIPVLAQHTDSKPMGSTTGSIVPEMLKSIGVTGSLVNHSERRIPFQEVKTTIARLKEAGLYTFACARTPREISRIATLSPDFLAIEPPELIGTGRAVSKVEPKLVSSSVTAAAEVDRDVIVICGAGIVSAEDVEASLKLGARGVLVSSAIVKASNWEKKIAELASPLAKSR